MGSTATAMRNQIACNQYNSFGRTKPAWSARRAETALLIFLTDGQESDPMEPDAASILSVPTDVLASLLLYLPPKDIGRCTCVCSRFRVAAVDDSRIWRVICETDYGLLTPVSNWLQPPQPWPLASKASTYRYAVSHTPIPTSARAHFRVPYSGTISTGSYTLSC